MKMIISANYSKKELLNNVDNNNSKYEWVTCADYMKFKKYKLLLFNTEKHLENYLKILDLFDFVNTYTKILDSKTLYLSNKTGKDAQFTFRLARQFLVNYNNPTFNKVIDEAFKENDKNTIWFKLCYLLSVDENTSWSNYTDIINRINITCNKYRNYSDLKHQYLNNFDSYSALCQKYYRINDFDFAEINIQSDKKWIILSNDLHNITIYIDESKGVISFEDFVKHFCDE